MIAAVPCSDPARAKEIFGSKNPVSAGILPVEVYLRNETDQLIRVDLETLRLDVAVPDGQRDHLEALSVEQVAREILHPAGAGDPDSARKHIPRPIPMPSHDKSQDKLTEKFRPLALETDIIPPHGTIHGYIFFDLGHDFSLLADSTLYVPDVIVVPTHHALTYFELNLASAAR